MIRSQFVELWRCAAVLAVRLLVGVAFGIGCRGGGQMGTRTCCDEQPKDAADVIALRKDAKDKQDVVVVGRIGGRPNPWIKGAAAFSIVDRSLKPCNEIEGDTCKTPWDYCCEADLPKATVLVMFVDDEGKIVKQDARELLGVKELDTLYHRRQGEARQGRQRDDHGVEGVCS